MAARPGATLAAVGEWGLLDRILPAFRRGAARRLRVGPGDDAAVIGRSVVTTDMLVEGVHFDLSWTSARDLGRKAMAVNLSDLAAMGDVAPDHAVVGLGLPARTPVRFAEDFQRGLLDEARPCGLAVAGGDTVRAPCVVVSVAAVGILRGRPILRSGAGPGDVVLVTGALGDAAAGLRLLQGRPSARLSQAVRSRLTGRLLRPTPRLEAGRRLARFGASAMMDVSDGFFRCLEILCRASGVGARLEAERLPLSPALVAWGRAAGFDPVDAALSGGEDYELLLTAPPPTAVRMEEEGLARAVGRVTSAREGVRVHQSGKLREVSRGFEHFDR